MPNEILDFNNGKFSKMENVKLFFFQVGIVKATLMIVLMKLAQMVEFV